MQTFVIFVLVFGGMIFVHEFGHFIVARLFKIPVEEFGFGFPPRVWRFWRSKGSLLIGDQRVEIPANFDLPFDWQNGLNEEAKASADTVNERLVLRSIELVRTEKMNRAPHALVDSQTNPAPEAGNPSQSSVAMPQGAVSLTGVLTKIEQGTEFTINALPLGGFVRPRGETDSNVPDGLAAANPWKRLGVLVAGPLMNLLTAVIVFTIIIAQSGIAIPGTVKIEEVTSSSPAEKAGLQLNDVILSINGTPVKDAASTRALIRANLDKEIVLVVERNGQQVTIHATPLSSRTAEQGALGVALGTPTRPATFTEAVTGGFTLTGLQSISIIYLPIGLLQGAIAPDEARLVGLKGIYDFFDTAISRDTQARDQVPQTGSGGATGGSSTPVQQQPSLVLGLIAMLSISLGIFNLFPIPALDGGRILFTLPEILFRRRIPARFENTVNGVAMMLLIMFMIFVNVMDFVNPVNMKIP